VPGQNARPGANPSTRTTSRGRTVGSGIQDLDRFGDRDVREPTAQRPPIVLTRRQRLVDRVRPGSAGIAVEDGAVEEFSGRRGLNQHRCMVNIGLSDKHPAPGRHVERRYRRPRNSDDGTGWIHDLFDGPRAWRGCTPCEGENRDDRGYGKSDGENGPRMLHAELARPSVEIRFRGHDKDAIREPPVPAFASVEPDVLSLGRYSLLRLIHAGRFGNLQESVNRSAA